MTPFFSTYSFTTQQSNQFFLNIILETNQLVIFIIHNKTFVKLLNSTKTAYLRKYISMGLTQTFQFAEISVILLLASTK